MKNEWTEQDLRQFVESSRPVFQDVSLTQVDEDADRCWQDDGLMVDYELRGGQVDCVLRRCHRWKGFQSWFQKSDFSSKTWFAPFALMLWQIYQSAGKN